VDRRYVDPARLFVKCAEVVDDDDDALARKAVRKRRRRV
jgi:hypothetical protein